MDATPPAFRPSFNGSIRIEGRPEKLTSEAGALILREAMDHIQIIEWMASRINDPRDPDLITHPMSELLRTSMLLLGMGWRDQDDADALRHDPTMRMSASDRRGTSPLDTRPIPEDGSPLSKNPEVPDGLASQPTLSRLVALLSTEEHRAVLRGALLEAAAARIIAMNRGHRPRYLTIDVDSLPVEVHGQQLGSEYNGHYHVRMYHPLVATVGETGDLLDLELRAGAVHTADGGLEFILALLDKVESRLCQVASVRIDAGFPEEKLLGAMEGRHTAYVARVKNNPVLDRMAAPHLKRPVGRPPNEPRVWFYEMTYQAESWLCARRVVLVVLERPDELFSDHFWLITNWSAEEMPAEELLKLYRGRGTAEGHMGELMSVLQPALSSSGRSKSHYRDHSIEPKSPAINGFKHNEVLLLLNAIAYNIAHAARCLMEIGSQQGWSLRRFRERVLRVAGRAIVHSRRVVFALARATAALWNQLWPKLRLLRLTNDTS